LNPQLVQPCYVLAGKPVTFAAWLKILRRAQTGGSLTLLPIPLAPVLLACDLFSFLPKERVLGLAAAEPMDSSASLAALGISPADPLTRLRQEETALRCDEATALLRYLGCEPSAVMKDDLALGLERENLSPLGLPRLF